MWCQMWPKWRSTEKTSNPIGKRTPQHVTWNQNRYWLEYNTMDSYEFVFSYFKYHFQSSFQCLFVHQSEDHVLLYKLRHCEATTGPVSVSLTMHVYKNMTLYVWINNTTCIGLDFITRNLFYSSGELLKMFNSTKIP